MLPDRAHLLLVASLALLLAGCAQVDDGPGEELGAMTMGPNTSASTLVMAEDIDADAGNVTVTVEDVEGLDLQAPDRVHSGDNGTVAGWITANATDEAELGEHNVTVTLEGEEDTHEGYVSITVEEPDDPLEEGEQAVVWFTALTQDGELAYTNNQTVAQSPVAHAQGYQEAQQYGATPIPLMTQGRPTDAMIEAMIGSGVNHTVNADVSEAFGPEVQQETQPREESIDRETQVPSGFELPRQSASQFLPADPQEGDVVDFPVTRDQPLPYRIENLTEENVNLTFALEEGDTLTLHQPWPDATNVTEVGDDQVTLRTTPTTQEGETFTWNENWGETTEVVEVTEDEIVLRHSPEVGQTYVETNPQTGEQVTVTIAEVTEQEIVIERENPHPLAGETLTFIITIDGRQDAPQRGPGPG